MTALGFGISGDAWGWLALAAFAVTLLAGLAAALGAHRFVAALLLNIWFIITIGVGAGFHHNASITSYTWAGFIDMVAVQVRLVLRASFPGLRAIESLATSVPLFLLLFAAAYVTLAALSPGSFGEHLTHTDGLYFTVTVFSTVGFGDITAKTETARLVVTGQMIADLIILTLAIKIIVGAVTRARQRESRHKSA